MPIVIDEMLIQLRATADGVKQGVAVAGRELNNFKKQRDELSKAIQLKMETSGINALKAQLAELDKRKKQLEAAVRFPVDSDSLKDLKEQLKYVSDEKQQLEENMKFNVDLADMMAAKDKIAELTAKKAELEGQIKLQIQADADKTKAELAEVNRLKVEGERELIIKMDTEGIYKAQTELKELNSTIKESEAASKAASAGYGKMAVAAGAAFWGITKAIGAGIKEFNKYTSTVNGLASQMKHLGISMDSAMETVRSKTSDGLVNESDIAASVKNLTTYGMTIEQASKLLDRLKDSAAYNRQAHYSLGEAVKVTTEGIRMENSMLSDAGGVTKNLAKMLEEYANSLGRTVDSLSQAEKAQAIYNGYMAETEGMIGNAAEYSKTLAGAQSELAAANVKMGQSFGEAMAPLVQFGAEVITPLVKGIIHLAKEYPGLTAGITTFSLVVSGAIMLSKGYTAAMGLWEIASKKAAASTGLLGTALATVNAWIIPIAVAVGLFTMVGTEIQNAKKRQEELNQKQKEYRDLMKGEASEAVVEGLRQRSKETKEVITQLDKLIEKQNEVNSFTSETMLKLITEKLKELGVYFKATGDLEKDMAEAKRLLNEELVKQTQKVGELNEKLKEQAEIEGLLAAADGAKQRIANLNELKNAYDKIAKGERLTAAEAESLAEKYPQISRYIAEKNDLTLEGGRIAQRVIKQEEEAIQRRLQIDINTAKTQLALNEQRYIAEVENMARLQALYDDTSAKRENAWGGAGRGNGFLSGDLEKSNAAIAEYSKNMSTLKKAIADMSAELGIARSSFGAAEMSTSDYIKSLDKLESAYQTLNSGQSLSYDTVMELVASYPQLAKLISDNGVAALGTGEIFRQIAEEEKKRHQESLQRAVEKAEAEAKMAASVVASYRAVANAKMAEYFVDGIGDEKELRLLNEKSTAIIKNMEDALARAEENLVNAKANLNAFNDSGNNKTSGSSSKSSATERNEALEKEIKLLNERKQLSYVSAQEEIEEIDRLIAKYGEQKDAKEQLSGLSANRRQLVRQMNDEWFDEEMRAIDKLNRGRADNTDFTDIINKYADLREKVMEIYAEYPDRMKPVLDQIEAAETKAAEQRADKVLGIQQDSVDRQIRELERQNDYFKNMSGVKVDGVEFKYSAEDEYANVGKRLAIVNSRIAELRAKSTREMSDAEYSELKSLLSKRESYEDDMTRLTIQGIKDRQSEEEKARQESIKEEEKTSKKRIETAKNLYTAQVKIAEDAADAEIKIIQDKIKAIDDLLKSEDRADQDAEQLDKINRLQQQLAYETDDANKYELQKEISNIQAEYDKRKRREGLEDEKSSLQEQMQAVKDSLAEQKKAFEEARDAEIAEIEQSLKAYTDSLEEKQLANATAQEAITTKNAEELVKRQTKTAETEASMTAKTSLELNKRLINTKDFLGKIYEETVETVKAIQRRMETGLNDIIENMWLRIDDFSSVGHAHGNAYGQAFVDASSRLIRTSNTGLTPSEQAAKDAETAIRMMNQM